MIKILVDSASDLTAQDKIYDYFMPIAVNIDGKEYLDSVDLNADTFYKLLLKTEQFPHTSQPSPQSFVEIFEKVRADGDELIYFAIASELSGTYQGATLAKNMVDYDKIYIIDTKTVTHAIGVLAGYAQKLIKEGYSAKEIVEKCEELKGKIKIYAGVDTLEYLFRGGRLSRISAAVGKIADIKPVVTITADGKVSSIGKCLGKARAMKFIVDKVLSYELDESFPICSLFTYGEENCLELEDKLSQKGLSIEKRLQVGSTIGTHVGPGGYGVLFVTK